MTERQYISEKRSAKSALQDALFVLDFLNENFSEMNSKSKEEIHAVVCNSAFTAIVAVKGSKTTVEASTFDGKFILTIEDK